MEKNTAIPFTKLTEKEEQSLDGWRLWNKSMKMLKAIHAEESKKLSALRALSL